MHMADALISPVVGGAAWAAAAALTVYSAKRVKDDADNSKIPLMGVLGAFVFAAQMINFTIPGTGSSGHLGGGMILSIVLGPHAAFLTMASILTVQSLLFADGGLLALGCNIVNLGFFPCFIAYPWVYRKIVGDGASSWRLMLGAMAASLLGLQLGALSVVAETRLSGISELPFGTFLMLMLPIHFAIGIVEGLATAGVVSFVRKARPELLEAVTAGAPSRRLAVRNVVFGFLVFAVVTAGALSWFASVRPDGLEWSMQHTSGKAELAAPQEGAHGLLAAIQEKTALLPDYNLKGSGTEKSGQQTGSEPAKETGKEEAWPAVNAGTSISGLVGVGITMLLVVLLGWGLRKSHNRTRI